MTHRVGLLLLKDAVVSPSETQRQRQASVMPILLRDMGMAHNLITNDHPHFELGGRYPFNLIGVPEIPFPNVPDEILQSCDVSRVT